jgi:hypothetical protein
MRVELSSVGNPDFGQNPNESLWGAEKDRMVEVATFEEASFECMRFIHDNDLGSGNWSGGDIFNEHGARIAYVSYNGRVWELGKDGNRYGGEEIKINREVVVNKIVELNRK